MTTIGDEHGRGVAGGATHGEGPGARRASVPETAQADLRGSGGGGLGLLDTPIPRNDPPGTDDDGPTEAATTVSGRLGTWEAAETLCRALVETGFSPVDIEVFYTGPAGRHGVTPIGGDASADAGSVHIGAGAAQGGLVGAATGFAIGAAFATAPVTGTVVLTAAALGAFGGALIGGVTSSEDGSTLPDTAEHPVAKPGGVVVAIRTDRHAGDEDRALRCLRASGAIGLERAPARWRDGAWVDWDPVAPREQLSHESGTPQA